RRLDGDDLVSGPREHFRDAGTHRAQPDDSDSPDLHGWQSLPEPGRARLEAAQLVVVENEAGDAALRREDARLRLDLLRREHAADGPQQRIAVEPFEVPGELFDPVDL